MNGIELNELCELVSHCHEAEFEYEGTTYVLQPEIKDSKAYLVIWDCTPQAEKCIAKEEIAVDGDIPPQKINAILSRTCFFGKCFLDIQDDVTVTNIQ